MAIEVGSRLPDATMTTLVDGEPVVVKLSDRLKGRKVVLFALPGAFTRTCSSSHMPSFVRTADQFRAKGVDEIICLAVNDPFVMDAWGRESGAIAAGITMLGDSSGAFTRAVGMAFDAPDRGFHGRSNRYALVLDDGVVTVAQIDKPGVCDLSTGEKLLAAI